MAPQSTTHQTPANPVREWRRRRLLVLGFAEAAARRLAADGRVDLHALLDLVDHGCPPELAVRILAPLDEQEPR